MPDDNAGILPREKGKREEIDSREWKIERESIPFFADNIKSICGEKTSHPFGVRSPFCK
jgi:hypothetical protein